MVLTRREDSGGPLASGTQGHMLPRGLRAVLGVDLEGQPSSPCALQAQPVQPSPPGGQPSGAESKTVSSFLVFKT